MDKYKGFVVNHFVPLFQWDNEALRGQSTTATSRKTTVEELAEENVYPWRVVTRKRRQKGQTEKLKSGKQNNKKTKANDQNTGYKPKRCSSGNAKVKEDKPESYAYQQIDKLKKERKQQKAKMQTTAKVNTKTILEIRQTSRRAELAWGIVWKTKRKSAQQLKSKAV